MIPIQITITPTTAGPFNLYSNVDFYTTPFDTNVPAGSLISGYTTSAPDGTSYVRVLSVGKCNNYVTGLVPCSVPTTTTTSTTVVETVDINWQLITGEPDNIGTVNLKIFINGIEQVDETISDGNLVESGVINVIPGALMTATMFNSKLGIWDFGNNIIQDGGLYQPQDVCFSCLNSLETTMDSASFILANTDFIFQGDVTDPTGPPTTTTTSTLPPPTTTTTTTIAIIQCGEGSEFNGGVSYPTTQIIQLGTATGTVNLSYDALNVPDRFIVEWNGGVVIDTGYRGSSIYDFGEPNRIQFTTPLTGQIDPITGNPYPDLVTYPDDGYPRIEGPGLGSTSFVKNLASDDFVTMKVYAPAKNTIWAYKMECPESPTTTTTTTTEAIVVKSGEISSFSNDTSACILGLDTPVFVTNPTGALPDIFVSTSSKVFLSDGVTLFAGNGDFYKIKYDGSSITTSQRVFADGSVGTITTCP